MVTVMMTAAPGYWVLACARDRAVYSLQLLEQQPWEVSVSPSF